MLMRNEIVSVSTSAILPRNISPAPPRGDGAPKPCAAVADRAASSLQDLKLSHRVPHFDVTGTALDRQRAAVSRESVSDESQKCDSSSELGTKPPSLDGKSITSGTTFALDEKESLRPDDSASVKAAAEDDDAFSHRGSLITGSRMSSEVAARGRNIQLGDIPERRSAERPLGTPGHGLPTPQSSASERPPAANPAMPLSADMPSDALNVIYRQAPDDKLLDALTSPRDRYFLLRLEKDVINFVQDSKEPYMDLPPSNAFCRMLTHKLADYYHMTHSYEPHIGAVRIFRTPFCRVPPSLATMGPQPSASTASTPPPALLPKKIMRRGQDNESGLVSAGASKPTSESGSDNKDGKDKQPVAKEKLSREEREEIYKLARERIFGSSEEIAQENEGENGMSRASSVSATNKAGIGKRGKTGKQRRDDSDSFDSRYQYTPYWGPQQQTWVAQPHGQLMAPIPGQFAGPPMPVYPPQAAAAPAYGQQPPAPYGAVSNMAPNPGYPAYAMPQVRTDGASWHSSPVTDRQQMPPQHAPPRYPSGGSPMTAYGSPVPPPAGMPPLGWQPNFGGPSYPPRGGPAPPVTSQAQVGLPYAYGQLPANPNPNDPKSQHPIPGSYNRNHAFNPKTQSFVPGGNGIHPVPPPQPPFTAPGSHHGSPQIGTPHLAYGGYQTGVPPPPFAGGYGMVRQESNTSMPPYHGPPQHVPPMPTMVPPPLQPMAQNGPPPMQQNPPTHIAGRPAPPKGPSQMYSHLPTYGNPATLPQKPASGI
ncbi:hypothetical protein CDD80_6904 [Ophiocordyceps camponoti-rufipedis]|uniref:R3H domain-containing protein n=1 Tax=Ophiocordyceps camponoti-rufipedis TaxID=2004952 RepID=A0A2C5ZN44_9HYPO|nr:hypothetical protein CDD80_6904 [Ophiocordyceps camponoti-rufipedis]